jgi:hypothetical protein
MPDQRTSPCSHRPSMQLHLATHQGRSQSGSALPSQKLAPAGFEAGSHAPGWSRRHVLPLTPAVVRPGARAGSGRDEISVQAGVGGFERGIKQTGKKYPKLQGQCRKTHNIVAGMARPKRHEAPVSRLRRRSAAPLASKPPAEMMLSPCAAGNQSPGRQSGAAPRTQDRGR